MKARTHIQQRKTAELPTRKKTFQEGNPTAFKKNPTAFKKAGPYCV
jgi:hypothetical protein